MAGIGVCDLEGTPYLPRVGAAMVEGEGAYARVSAACLAMTKAEGPIPSKQLAELVGVSERQLQRDFNHVMGVGPREYGEAVRTEHAKRTLAGNANVTDAIYEAGYGSVRAFYEEVGQRLGMTPSEYQQRSSNVELIWSTSPSAVGVIIAVATPKGLAAARIGTQEAELIEQITQEFRGFKLTRNDVAMRDVMAALRLLALGNRPRQHRTTGSDTRSVPQLPIDVQGTAFQARVWQALTQIEEGHTKTYAQVAQELGQPTATRAVARACATNKVALAIPCHRVIRSDGSLAGYAWGLEVKQQLLASEARP